MKRTIVQRPEARKDLVRCFAYLWERNPRVADRFLKDVNTTFSTLTSQPGRGELYDVANPQLQGLRCSRVSKFEKYLIFYLPIEEGIDVVRVLHGARDIPTLLKEE